MKVSRCRFLVATGTEATAAALGLRAIAQGQNEVLIGSVLPLTGPIAPIGHTNRQGLELAVEEISAAGGIKALNGAKLRIAGNNTASAPGRGLRGLRISSPPRRSKGAFCPLQSTEKP
jgi:branched-chain amino acid transport system substrate-binding protein